MYSLEVIEAINANPPTLPPKRRCSVGVHRTSGGDVVGIILHSARERATAYIKATDPFQWGFFKLVCGHYGLLPERVVVDPDAAEGDALDKVVESYWGYYPQPSDANVPGRDEAPDVDADEWWTKWDDPDYDPDSDPRNAAIDAAIAARP